MKKPLKFNWGVYQEHESTFTHHGKEYDLNKLFVLTKDLPAVKVAMRLLAWNLMDGLDQTRVQATDVSVPLLVSLENGIYYVLDGNHRLVKLSQQKKIYADVVLIPSNILAQCLM